MVRLMIGLVLFLALLSIVSGQPASLKVGGTSCPNSAGCPGVSLTTNTNYLGYTYRFVVQLTPAGAFPIGDTIAFDVHTSTACTTTTNGGRGLSLTPLGGSGILLPDTTGCNAGGTPPQCGTTGAVLTFSTANDYQVSFDL